jgi:hypothetical protein
MRAAVITGYLAVIVAAVVLDVVARRPGSRLATFGDLVSRISARRAGRAAMMLGWWWLGWHYFVR